MTKNKLFLTLVVVSMAFFLVGCENDASDPKNVDAKNIPAAETSAGVLCYGNGVYYFPYTEAEYGNALSRFIKDHPELELVDATGDGHHASGIDRGYFVVFRNK